MLGQESVEPHPDAGNSELQGLVTTVSPNGKSTRLEGVVLKLSGAPAIETAATASDAEGHYRFDHLAAGLYQLEARLDGFESFAKTIRVGRGEVHLEDVILSLQILVQKVNVNDQAPKVATESASPTARLTDRQFQALPLAEQKFKETLPLVPGVVRTRDGKLNMKGEAENQGMLLVDSAQTVDPVTGSFTIPVPFDAIKDLRVDKTPYDSEYGGFSGGLTAINTKPPSDSWHYGLMDFIPGVRGKAGHIVGLSSETPRLYFGGPIWKNKLNFSEAATYDLNNRPVRGLAWPNNETQVQGFNSLTSIQAVLSPQHLLSMNVIGFSTRVRYADISSLVPQPASSDDGQRGVSVGLNDSVQFGSAGVLNTTARYTRFDSNAHGQGPGDMLLTPEGWGGNFFNSWTRTSDQFELRTMYQFPKTIWFGRHEVKAGADLAYRSYRGSTYSHPIRLLREDGSLEQRIDFQGEGRLDGRDTEIAEFLQDHWSVNDRLALNLGARLLSQSLGRSAAFAPRAGIAYSPGEDRKTVARAGVGLFYDSVPLLAAGFAGNPTRVVTLFDGSGLPLGPPLGFQNACVVTSETVGPLPTACPTPTSARNLTASAEINRELPHRVMLRVSYLYSQTRGLGIVTPIAGPVPTDSLLALASTGGSHYHEIETTLHYRTSERAEFNLSYIHSRGRGDLNTLASVFVPFEQPVIRQNFTGNFASDVPNRFVSWGILSLPGKLTMSPVVDVRTGFPYSNVDAYQDYAGLPNTNRFPAFFSLDVRLYREFKLGALPLMGRFKNRKLRFGVYSINLSNHTNFLDVYNNVASPYFGRFAGFQHRVDGLVIDTVD